MDMTSTRPYLIRGIYDWIIDNRCTPYLLVDASAQGVRVPRQAIKEGQVLLNIAPLHTLIPSWAAEPKKAWKDLERGDYDWAHTAMRYWPDRVLTKCKINKSFAIAHGVE